MLHPVVSLPVVFVGTDGKKYNALIASTRSDTLVSLTVLNGPQAGAVHNVQYGEAGVGNTWHFVESNEFQQMAREFGRNQVAGKPDTAPGGVADPNDPAAGDSSKIGVDNAANSPTRKDEGKTAVSTVKAPNPLEPSGSAEPNRPAGNINPITGKPIETSK